MRTTLRISGLSVLLLLTAVFAASAQEVTVIKAARMLDVRTGRLIPAAVVVIEGDRITAVNPGPMPKNAKVIDLGDVTLLPGFIDMHVHLTGQLGERPFRNEVLEGAAADALRGAYHARKTLLAGFTTVRDMGSGEFSAVDLQRAIERGYADGPRIFAAGHGLGITGGHCDITGYRPGVMDTGPEQGVADGVDEVLKAVRYQIKYGAKVIKTCATAGVLSFEDAVGAQQYTEEELRAIAEEAHRHGLRASAHAHGTEGIMAATRAGIDSIEHGSILTDEAIALMKEHGTYLVPTTYLADTIPLDVLPPAVRAKAERVLPLAKESIRKAVAAGVKIAFGTDAAVFPHGDNAKEFAALVDRGMTPLAAIQSATVNAIDLLGVDDRGVVEAGRLADIIAVEGNPLEDITATERVRFVMKGGEIFRRP